MSQKLSRREEEQQMKQEGRLPPGQSLTQKFPVLHYGSVPEIDLESWEFRVWGEVEEELTWTWGEFSRLPRTEIKMDVHCVTRWSMFDTIWEGVSPAELIEQKIIQPAPEAGFVVQHAAGGYTTNLPLEIFLQDNFLMATHFNGEPLTPEHGYPLRGVVGHFPDRDQLTTPYFWKGAKWLIGLEFTRKDQPGFWEKAGYHNEGNVWKEQRTT
jgi:DMSO/TMAO reductase YedYZ molybdopterin-dependent catalytic subunit